MSAATKLRRKEAGFELAPARCVSCKHFRPPMWAVPGRLPYVGPWCNLHDFHVAPSSICDDWEHGKTGEVLE